MQVEKLAKDRQESLLKFQEGLSDVLQVVTQIHQDNNIECQQSSQAEKKNRQDQVSDRSSQDSTDPLDQELLAQTIIGKVFEVQRHY